MNDTILVYYYLFSSILDFIQLYKINLIVFSVFDTGSMYAADDPIILKAEGLDKPRKKRGRPKKVVQPELEVLTDNAISRNVEVSNDDSAKKDESTDKEEDLDGRKRRKRRVPQRYHCCIFHFYRV